MPNVEQLEELESIQAIYDGSDDVIVSLPGVSGSGDNDDDVVLQLSARISASSGIVMIMSIRLPSGYLGSAEPEAPRFELSSVGFSHSELSLLCKQLDSLFLEQDCSSILFVWFEWLRMDVETFLESVVDGKEESDCRAIVLVEDPPTTREKEQAAKCANCMASADQCGPFVPLGACDHAICSKCRAAALQTFTANEAVPCCPLPGCQAEAPSSTELSTGPMELWGVVARQVLGTHFQDVVVFCPRCEDRGVDVPILMAGPCLLSSADSGDNNYRCFGCEHDFCGVCRSPCHLGRSCWSEPSQVVRMSKRRPPLIQQLHEVALERADKAAELELKRNEEFRVAAAAMVRNNIIDFDAFRQEFKQTHYSNLLKGLSAVFNGVTLWPTPLSDEVKARFMRAFKETQAEIRPAFHGTNAGNYNSIFQRGLLVPGVGNELKIVHGAAHGCGVYTANIDSAWLSRGFCSEQSMLVCAVVHTGGEVRHHGDAMIIGRAELVVPLFLATDRCEPPVGTKQPSAKATIAAPPQAQVASKEAQKTDGKSSKFKARLAKKSQRR